MRDLKAGTRREAVEAMVRLACGPAGLEPEAIAAAVWAREEALSTGIGHGVALPHARVAGLREPIVAVGICDARHRLRCPRRPAGPRALSD